MSTYQGQKARVKVLADSTASRKALDANYKSRTGASFANKSTTASYYLAKGDGTGVGPLDNTVEILPGGFYELYPADFPGEVWGAWSAIDNTSTGFLIITED